jgi:hypothetical protein
VKAVIRAGLLKIGNGVLGPLASQDLQDRSNRAAAVRDVAVRVAAVILLRLSG